MECATGARLGFAAALVVGALGASGCGGFHALADAAVDGGFAPDGDTTSFTIVEDNSDGGALRAVWGSSTNDVYIAGDNGVVIHYDTGSWNRLVLGAGNDLAGVWASAADDVWVVGTRRDTKRGLLYHRTTGNAFTQFGTVPFGLKAVWGVDDLRFAGGVAGEIYSGTKATPFSKGIQVQPNAAIPVTPDAPIVWSIGGNASNSVLFAADVDTFLWHDGANFHEYADPIDRTRAYRAAWGPPSGGVLDLYLGANYYGLWHFTGKGDPVFQLHEEHLVEDVTHFIHGVWGTDDGRYVVCVGDGGRIMTYHVKRQELVVRTSPTGRDLFGVWGTSLDDVWIVGDGGLVIRAKIAFP